MQRSRATRFIVLIGSMLLTGLPCLRGEAAAPPDPGILEQLQSEAGALRGWVATDLAREFLAATSHLPQPEPRKLLRAEDRSRYYSEEDAAGLTAEEKKDLDELEIDAGTYYTTKYGSPLAYVRAVDLLAGHGLDSFAGKRVLDFGYGTVGHLRLMASLGAEAVGVDVDPFLLALYSRPGDRGAVKSPGRPDGRVTLVEGQWPAEERVRSEVGGGFDLFISKNTLKRGYIHPEREADPRRLVHLGVDDATFLSRLFEAMSPGGLAIIYNLSPPQAPPDKPYIPWADGRCPFPRELLERTGFRVLAYDVNDDKAAREMARLLGWDRSGMDPETQLFAHHTIFRKPPSGK